MVDSEQVWQQRIGNANFHQQGSESDTLPFKFVNLQIESQLIENLNYSSISARVRERETSKRKARSAYDRLHFTLVRPPEKATVVKGETLSRPAVPEPHQVVQPEVEGVWQQVPLKGPNNLPFLTHDLLGSQRRTKAPDPVAALQLDLFDFHSHVEGSDPQTLQVCDGLLLARQKHVHIEGCYVVGLPAKPDSAAVLLHPVEQL